MPITYDIQPDKALAIAVHEGVVPDGEFLSAYNAMFTDPRFERSYNLLVDLRRADSSARGTAALKELAEFVRVQYSNVDNRPRVAVIAPENISFGLARMYEAFSDAVPWDFRVFRGVPDALEWLGIDRNFLDPTD